MNLTNATILTRATATTNAAGKRLWNDATTLRAGAFLDVPDSKQRVELGAVVENATAVLYVAKTALPASVRAAGFSTGDKLSVIMDGGTARDHEVVGQIDRQKSGGLAHFEVYLKVVQ